MTDQKQIPQVGTHDYREWLDNSFPNAEIMPRMMDDLYLHTYLKDALFTGMNEAGRAFETINMPAKLATLPEENTSIDILGRRYPDARLFSGLKVPKIHAALIRAHNARFTDFKAPSGHFHYADLRASAMERARFSEADFYKANLCDVQAKNSLFDYVKFGYTEMRDAHFEQCDMSRSIFDGVEAQGVQFIGTQEKPIHFKDSVFAGRCYFQNAYFQHCDFSSARTEALRGHSFKGATFEDCKIPERLRGLLIAQGATVLETANPPHDLSTIEGFGDLPDLPPYGTPEYTEYLRDRFPVCKQYDTHVLGEIAEDPYLYEHLLNRLVIGINKTPSALSYVRAANVTEAPNGEPKAYADLISVLDDLPIVTYVSIAGTMYKQGSSITRVCTPSLNATLTHAQRCHFSHFSAPESMFIWTNLPYGNFVQCDFSKSNFYRANLDHSQAYGVDYSHCDFSRTRICETEFEHCDFPKAKFIATIARNALFKGNEEELCNMRGAIFSNKCDFADAVFEYCDLTAATVTPDADIDFNGAVFSHCRMPSTLKAMLEHRGATVESNCTIDMLGLPAPAVPLRLAPPKGYVPPDESELGAMQRAALAGPEAGEFMEHTLAEERKGDGRAYRQKGEVPKEVVDQAIKDGRVTSIDAFRQKKEGRE